MRFRLTYEGPLKSSQPQHKSKASDGQITDKRAEHKHVIRRHFHNQLKELWNTNAFLKEANVSGEPYGGHLPPTNKADWQDDPKKLRRLDVILSDIFSYHKDNGYRYAPLIWKECLVSCTMRVLCLRLDHDEAISAGRDIDNRIKTLIDSLTMPSRHQGPPLKDRKSLAAAEDEKPFYVLLDDDRRISHLEVETDQLLGPIPTNADDSYVKLIISIEIRPTFVTMFNMSFG